LRGIPDFGRWDRGYPPSEEELPELIEKDELFHEEPYYTWNPAEKALASQYLPAALESLTARQREAFKMRYEENMKVTHIAKQLRRSRQAIHKRLRNANKRLEKFLNNMKKNT
jgi:RNA polymerase sigma factor (sigma-70 family)